MESKSDHASPSARKLTLKETLKAVLIPPVIVGALGYFVDIYDLVLFSIVRVPSLKGLGISGDALLTEGVKLINIQMIGMLVGGVLWGILGDKKGRISVLFGSIALYSGANLLNAFVTNMDQYAFLRFIAGVGLAGELGAAITLVAESLPKNIRGIGTTVVATIGICGAVFGGVVSEFFTWRISYIVGGLLGVALLIVRIRLRESGMFSTCKSDAAVSKGDLRLLFKTPARIRRYLQCILIGLPVWFAVGILMTFAPELGRALELTEPVTGGKAIFWGYAGLAVGDLTSGLLSQMLGSRRRAVGIYLGITALFTAVYGMAGGVGSTVFYAICFAIGVGVGYWALFVTIAAEQFGTNLRATVTISVPNFVRGAVVPITLAFSALTPGFGILPAAMIVGAATLVIAFLALAWMEETFGKELNYLESET
jgi:MFS transporter, putative metabolite:H+ symporter